MQTQHLVNLMLFFHKLIQCKVIKIDLAMLSKVHSCIRINILNERSIVNGIFTPSYWSMKVIQIDLVMLIRLHSCILRNLSARLKSARWEDSKGTTTNKAEARTPLMAR